MNDEQTDDLNGFPTYKPDFEQEQVPHPLPLFSGILIRDADYD